MKTTSSSRSWKNGCYQTVVPIYDVTEPLEISLIGPEGLIETTKIDLKERWRKEPFPLAVGSILSDRLSPEVEISPAELPEKWQAYGNLSGLWLTGTRSGITPPKWSAITKWVYMGGQLIIFGGSNFPVLDSPELRKLLPIASPSLIEENGDHRLTGETKAGSRILLEDEGGPLMSRIDFGAGKVHLIAEDPSGLTTDELSKVQSKLEPSEVLSLKSGTGDLLDEEKLNTPGRTLAVLTAAPLLFSVLLFSRWPEDDRKKALSLAIAALTISVIPLMTIEKGHITRDIYSASIDLHLDVEGGLKVGWQKLYSTSSGGIYLHPEAEPYPMVEIPRKTRGENYDTSWVEGRGLKLPLEKGSRRQVVYSKKETSKLNVRETEEGKLEIENRLNEELSKAFLIVQGEFFRLEVSKEEKGYRLKPEEIKNIDSPHQKIVEKIREKFPVSENSWFVGLSGRVDHPNWNGLSVNSRKIDIYLEEIKGGGGRNDG